MADIFKFLSGEDRETTKVVKFKDVLLTIRPMTKKSLRKAEMKLLTPEEYPEYADKKGVTDPLKDIVCKIAFKTEGEFELFKKHFRVADYGGNNVADLRLLMAFLNALELGLVAWFEKEEKLVWGYHESGGNKKKKERRVIPRRRS